MKAHASLACLSVVVLTSLASHAGAPSSPADTSLTVVGLDVCFQGKCVWARPNTLLPVPCNFALNLEVSHQVYVYVARQGRNGVALLYPARPTAATVSPGTAARVPAAPEWLRLDSLDDDDRLCVTALDYALTNPDQICGPGSTTLRWSRARGETNPQPPPSPNPPQPATPPTPSPPQPPRG